MFSIIYCNDLVENLVILSLQHDLNEMSQKFTGVKNFSREKRG